MELIRLNKDQPLVLKEKTVAGIGQFDGLHIGHMKLIDVVIAKAKKSSMKSAVITFDPHPDYVLKKRENTGYITPLSEKMKILEKHGIDYLVLIEFDVGLSEMEPDIFYNKYLAALETVVIGSDFRFGYRGQGSVKTLLAKGKDVEIIDVVKQNQDKISSNHIRDLLSQGDVKEITRHLGRYYNITGKVGHGSKVGRTLGIKTANVEIPDEYQLLKKGVYAVLVEVDGMMYLGACNIGNNPSINYVEKPRLEVHIFDFNTIIYDHQISIDFLERLREEKVFDCKEELFKQIQKDIEYIKERFAKKI